MAYTKKSRRRMWQVILLISVIVGGIAAYFISQESDERQAKEHKQDMEGHDSTQSELAGARDTMINKVGEVKEQINKQSEEASKRETEQTNDIKEHITKQQVRELILVTPTTISVPAKAAPEVRVVITNNRSYPVFMVQLVLQVEDGDVNLVDDCEFTPHRGLELLGTATKYRKFDVVQIDAKGTFTGILKINGHKYERPSRIKIAVTHFMKSPPPDFTMNTDTFPQTINMGKGTDFTMYENK